MAPRSDRRHALAYVDQPVGLVSSTTYIRAMKAKRLSRLAVEGLSDTGYVVGHESNIESEAADDDQQKVRDTLRIRLSVSSIIPLDRSKADSLPSWTRQFPIKSRSDSRIMVATNGRDWNFNTGLNSI